MRPEKTGSEIERFIDIAIDKSGIDATWVWKDMRFDDGGLFYSSGCCYFNQREIALSKKFCERMWEFHKEEIIELIAHELAHIKIANHSYDFKYEMVLIKAKLMKEINLNNFSLDMVECAV